MCLISGAHHAESMQASTEIRQFLAVSSSFRQCRDDYGKLALLSL